MQGQPFMSLGWDEERLVPDILLPVQFTKRAIPSPPEIALLRAVLTQAMKDLMQYRRPRSEVSRHVYRDAYNWVASTSRSHPFTFVNVCESLCLSSQAVRASVLRKLRRPALIRVGEAA